MLEPKLQLNFAKAQRLDPRISFSRNSIGTYFDKSGVLRTASANQPRFNFNPVTGKCEGLMVEEASENLLTYSEDFRNTAAVGETRPWIYQAITISPNQITAPDGALTADKLIVSTTTNWHALHYNMDLPASGTYTVYCFAKSAEETTFSIYFRTETYSNGFRGFYDLSNVTTSGASIGTGTYISSSIIPIGNGWFLCSVTGTVPSNNDETLQILPRNTSYLGDGVSGFYIWGTQVEQKSFATSYIPTTTSTVTRVVEDVKITGSNFSSWYNQSEGTFIAKAYTNEPISDGLVGIFAANDGTSNNRIDFRVQSNTNRSFISSSGVTQANPVTSTPIVSVPFTGALSYNTDAFHLYSNGTTLSSDTAGTVPTVSQLQLGSFDGTTNYALNGCIERLTYYDTAITGSTLQALSKQ